MNRCAATIVSLALVVATTTTGLTGCATATRTQSPEIGSASVRVIADDFCGQFQRRFTPAETVVHIDRKASSPEFATSLEHGLRASGYAIASDVGSASVMDVVATLIPFDEEHAQAVVDVKGKLQLARLYVRGEEGVPVAASAFTCREEKRAPVVRGRARAVTPPATAKVPVTLPACEQQSPTPAPPDERSPLGEEKRVASVIPEKNEAPVVPSTPAVMPALAAPAREASPEKIAEDAIEVAPDREGVVELSPAIARRRDGATPNPFEQEYRPRGGGRELSLAISGVVLGPTPTVVINGRVYSVGDSVEGFSVVAIQHGVVRLRNDPFLLRLSVSDQPVVVKCL